MKRADRTIKCTVADCTNAGKLTRGWCRMHYARWLREGTTDVQRRYMLGVGAYERVMARLVPDGDCLVFQGSRSSSGGYGQLRVKGKLLRAHRVVLEHHYGPGDIALHSCDNPPCCNIDHLRWGSFQDNAIDACERGRCVHVLTMSNPVCQS